MTLPDAVNLIQSGGVIACLIVGIWAFVTRRIISRGEFDRLEERFAKMEQDNIAANEELRKQSSTNARLVEMTVLQRGDAERIRREQGAGDER